MTKSKDILSNTTLTVIVMLLSISFVGLSIVAFQLKDMHNNAENRYADVWCQDQTYEKLILNESSHYVDFVNEILYINQTVEIRHYITGRYLSDESKIECLGEPRWVGCVGINGNPCSEEFIKETQEYQKTQKFDVPM